MFLSAVLFVLFLAGCWLYCLTDAVLTPAAEFPGLSKPVWIAAIAVTFILGAIAWVIARKWWRTRHRPLRPAARAGLTGYDVLNVPEDPDRPTSADRLTVAEALARHPASRSRNMPGQALPSARTTTPSSCGCSTALSAGRPTPASYPESLPFSYTEPTGNTRLSDLRRCTWEEPFELEPLAPSSLAAALAGGGLTTVRLLGSGHEGATNPVASGTPTASGKASAESFGAALTGTPQVAAVPHVAVMPAHAARATGKPAPSGSHPGPSVSSTVPLASHPAMGQAPSQSSPPAPSGSAACAHPQYVTSDPSGMWNLSPYFLANDMWNVSAVQRVADALRLLVRELVRRRHHGQQQGRRGRQDVPELPPGL